MISGCAGRVMCVCVLCVRYYQTMACINPGLPRGGQSIAQCETNPRHLNQTYRRDANYVETAGDRLHTFSFRGNVTGVTVVEWTFRMSFFKMEVNVAYLLDPKVF